MRCNPPRRPFHHHLLEPDFPLALRLNARKASSPAHWPPSRSHHPRPAPRGPLLCPLVQLFQLRGLKIFRGRGGSEGQSHSVGPKLPSKAHLITLVPSSMRLRLLRIRRHRTSSHVVPASASCFMTDFQPHSIPTRGVNGPQGRSLASIAFIAQRRIHYLHRQHVAQPPPSNGHGFPKLIDAL